MKTRKLFASALALVATSLPAWCGAPENLIAKLQPGVDPQFLAATYGIVHVASSPSGRYQLFRSPDLLHHDEIAASIRSSGSVAWIEDDDDANVAESTNGKGGSLPQLRYTRLGTLYSPGALYAENTHLLQQISWNYEPTMRDRDAVRVAVLDTGLSPLQPTLWDRTVASATFIPRESVAWDYRVSPALGNTHNGVEVTGHGTMVAGLVAQLAPDCELIIARVADNYGQSDAWKILEGLDFAMMNGAQIVNISMGSVKQLASINEALDDLGAANALLISPLGNNDMDQALYPARYSAAMAVSGLDDLDVKAGFSNYQNTADISAPATSIRSAWWDGHMAVWHGTSFAAPIVAGCIAEGLKNARVWNAADLLDASLDLGDDIDALNLPAYHNKLGRRVNLNKIRAYFDSL